MKKGELTKKQNYKVVKGNELARCRHCLTVPEQRALAYICSIIPAPKERMKGSQDQYEYTLEYTFTIKDFCEVCQLSTGGQNYIDIKKTIKGLADNSFWIQYPDRPEVQKLTRWIKDAEINEGDGTITVHLDEKLVPYLFNINGKFMEYRIRNILRMKSQYSIHLYEILHSYLFQHKYKVNVDELKKILMVDDIKSYVNSYDFKKRVLDPALKEINNYTDIQVTYEPVTKGRKVIQLNFTINKAKGKDDTTSEETNGTDANSDPVPDNTMSPKNATACTEEKECENEEKCPFITNEELDLSSDSNLKKYCFKILATGTEIDNFQMFENKKVSQVDDEDDCPFLV